MSEDPQDGRATQADLNRKAKDMTDRAQDAPERPENVDSGGKGPSNTPRPDMPPSGALDAEGHRPVLERSRKVR